MKNIFNWQIKQVNNSIFVLMNKTSVGRLLLSDYSLTAHAELFDKAYQFKRKHLFSVATEVTMQDDLNPIVLIRQNIWTSGSKIKLTNSIYLFKYKNLFCREWNIFDNNGKSIIDSKRTNNNSEIVYEEENHVLFLCGLYLSGNDFIESSNITWVLLIVILYCTIF